MTADLDTFLNELRQAGLKLCVDGSTLRVKGPASALTPEIRAALATYKTDIINHLRPPSVMHKDITRGHTDSIKLTIDAGVRANGLNQASVGGRDGQQGINLTAFFGTEQKADAAYRVTKTPVRLTWVTAIIDGKKDTTVFESDAEADQHIASLEKSTCACGNLTRRYHTAPEPAECDPCAQAWRDADPAKWVLSDGNIGLRAARRVPLDGFHEELVKVWHHTPGDFRHSVYDGVFYTRIEDIFNEETANRECYFRNVYKSDAKHIPIYFWKEDPVDLWRHDPDAWLLQVRATSLQDWHYGEYRTMSKPRRKRRGLNEPPKQWHTVRTDHLWLHFHEPDAQGVPTAIVAMHGAMTSEQALVAYRRAQRTHPNLHFRMYQPHTDTGVMLPDAMQKAAARQQP